MMQSGTGQNFHITSLFRDIIALSRNMNKYINPISLITNGGGSGCIEGDGLAIGGGSGDITQDLNPLFG